MAEGAGAGAEGTGAVTTEAVVEGTGVGTIDVANRRSNHVLLSEELAHLIKEKLGRRIHDARPRINGSYTNC